MAMSTAQNSLSIPSCSCYSTRTACNSERLDLYKPVMMMMDCTSGYTNTQKDGRHLHINSLLFDKSLCYLTSFTCCFESLCVAGYDNMEEEAVNQTRVSYRWPSHHDV